MIAASILVTLQLVALHRPDGKVVHINPAEITALTAPRRGDTGKIANPAANCVVFLSDKHFFQVIETCDAVRQLLAKPD